MSYIWNNGLPRIIAPFWCEKRNNQHWLLFEEIQSPPKISGVQQGLAHGLYISTAVLYQLSHEDPNIWSRPICWVHLNPWKEWNIEIKEWRWCELRKYTFVVWCVAHDINFSRGCHYIIISHSGVCKRHCANAQGFPGSTSPEHHW